MLNQAAIVHTDQGLALPAIRKIRFADLGHALSDGFDDFMAMPSHAIFLIILYPIIGVFLGPGDDRQ